MQRDALFISEIIQACQRIQELTSEYQQGNSDLSARDTEALLWNFTVLGEAANQISEELKEANGQINWSDPIRMRNRIIHGYWSIDIEILIATAKNDLPELTGKFLEIKRQLQTNDG